MLLLNCHYQFYQIFIINFTINILQYDISIVSLTGLDLEKLCHYNLICYLVQSTFTLNYYKIIYKCFQIHILLISSMQCFLILIHLILKKCHCYYKIIILFFVVLCNYFAIDVCAYYIYSVLISATSGCNALISATSGCHVLICATSRYNASIGATSILNVSICATPSHNFIISAISSHNFTIRITSSHNFLISSTSSHYFLTKVTSSYGFIVSTTSSCNFLIRASSSYNILISVN